MAITKETVLHVAKLARLDLAPDEVTNMQRDLDNILSYVEELSQIDTTNVAETAHVAVAAAPLRHDARRPGVENELAMSQAPRSSGGAFAVPGFMEES